MDLGLSGKWVLITAASGGLGPSLASSFMSEGASVILVSRSKDKLDKLRKKLTRNPELRSRVEIVTLDLDKLSAPERLLNWIQNKKIDLDIVVHHLGGTLGVKSSVCKRDEWTKVIWHNALFAITFNGLIAPFLLKREWARVVHVSSISGKSLRGSGPYAASKAFLDAYVTTVSREFGGSNVVFSSVSPGALLIQGGDWEKKLKNNPSMCKDFLRHHQACGRFGAADEIAPFILLLSSRLATFSQGANCNIDGGTM